MSSRVSLPSFYLNKHWQDSIGTMPLMQRLQERIDEIERKLPNMTLKEKQDIWSREPYYEVSKLIVESKDWVFPNK